MDEGLKVSLMGEDGLLLDPAGERFDETVQRRIWGLSRRLTSEPWVAETVPGMNNLLVLLAGATAPLEQVLALLRAWWAEQTPAESTGRTIEAQVVYGGEAGGDLPELAACVGLSVREVVRLHAEAAYTVAAVGAMPGFPYLSGLDPLLAWPRLTTPRLALAGGAVIIGGAQAGVMPYTAPSGWRSIGHTDLELFDIGRDAAVLLEPGDELRFLVADVIG